LRPAVLAVAVVVAAAALAGFLLLYTARPSETPKTTTTPTPRTTPTTRVETTPTQTRPVKEVIISNPPGSATNTSMTFQPAYVKVVIGVNNTVVWVNEDTALHTVTSTARFFDYQLQPGQRASYTFTRPGRYDYSCTVHPWMQGVVEVVAQD
jgi:plastocyanin